MAKSDWNISGTGSYQMIAASPGGSGTTALELLGVISAIYNGKGDFGNTEIEAWVIVGTNRWCSIYAMLQSLTDLLNGYEFRFSSASVNVYRVVGGGAYLLASDSLVTPITDWTKIRVRVKDYKFSIEQFNGSTWDLVLNGEDLLQQWSSGGCGFESKTTAKSLCLDDVNLGEETP